MTNLAKSDKEEGDPEGPLWYTFTFMLPFGLGLTYTGSEVHYISLEPSADTSGVSSPWRDAAAAEDFGAVPLVRIKFYAKELDGLEVVPENLDAALEALYGQRLTSADMGWPLLGDKGEVYEQWVSIETQGARLIDEDPGDRAYAFHRALHGLNAFLTAYSLAFGASEVHPIDTRDMGKVMVRGVYDSAGKWGSGSPILMHMEHWLKPAAQKMLAEVTPKVDPAIQYVKGRHPYLPAKLWFDRSRRAAMSGDQIARVVSLQTAAETLLFTTWTMTMVDGHKSSTQIDQATRGPVRFESLFKTKLPNLLGGSWDSTKRADPPGQYWHDLYKLRNRVVHAGVHPDAGRGRSCGGCVQGDPEVHQRSSMGEEARIPANHARSNR